MFRSSLAKILSNLIMISICEKVWLQQLTKAKYSILESILHIFQKMFLTQSHTYLYNTLCKSHDFLISYFESGHFSIKVTFWENSFRHSFLIFFEQYLNNIFYLFYHFLNCHILTKLISFSESTSKIKVRLPNAFFLSLLTSEV